MNACHTWISKFLSFALLGGLLVSCSSSMKVLTTPVSVGGDAVEESELSHESEAPSSTIIDDELVMTVYANSPVGLVAPIRGAAGYQWEQVSGPSSLN